ncbi:MAG: ribosome biogenesis GTPase Der [Pseudomonadota bacterium]|nr:ribosome biogenesis GTPase Der [Pseudomonadota bacterium]
MKNLISLVGRTNVGKSLLFNKLVKSRKSLVIDHHGITRDINTGFIDSKGKRILVEDTGGFLDKTDPLSEQVNSKIIKSIRNSSLVLFITSCSEGLTSKDSEISKLIRKQNKKVFLIINKNDLLSKQDNLDQLYKLGFKDVFLISAKSNLGISELKSKIFEILTAEEIGFEKKHTKVSLIGRPNVGKSTLINTIIKDDKMIVSKNSGTTLDSVKIEFMIKRNIYLLYDTAGLLRKGKRISIIQKFSMASTIETIKNTDICLLILDAEDGITKQDKIILSLIKKYNKPFLIIFNKIDNISQEAIKNLKKDANYFSNITYNAPYTFVSALKRKNIKNVMNLIIGISKLIQKRYKSSELTKILYEAVNDHEPPIFNKKRPKLKFAQQGKLKELIIYIYGNGTKNISLSYQKYLASFFSKKLNLIGVPLELKFSQKREPI